MPHKQSVSSRRYVSQANSFITNTGSVRQAAAPAASRHGQSIGKLRVRPGQQSHVPLGNFTDTQPPKGFSVELNPDPTPDDSIVTKVLSFGTAQRYSLTLHIANYGTATVTAEIRQL